MAKVKGKAGLRVDIDLKASTFAIYIKEGEKETRRAVFDVAELPEEIALEAQLRGTAAVLQQRASDGGSADDRLDQIVEVWEMWLEGDYRSDRKAGAQIVNPIIEALAKAGGHTIPQVQASWSKLDDETKDKLKAKYAKEIEAIKVDRAAKKDEAGIDLTKLV